MFFLSDISHSEASLPFLPGAESCSLHDGLFGPGEAKSCLPSSVSSGQDVQTNNVQRISMPSIVENILQYLQQTGYEIFS